MFCSLFPKYCFMEWNHRHSSPTISIHLIISGNSLSLSLRLFVFVFHCNILKTKNTKTRKKKKKGQICDTTVWIKHPTLSAFSDKANDQLPLIPQLSLSLSVLRFLCSFLNPCFLDLSLASWIPEKKKFFSLPPSPPQFIAKHTVYLSLSLSHILYFLNFHKHKLHSLFVKFLDQKVFIFCCFCFSNTVEWICVLFHNYSDSFFHAIKFQLPLLLILFL